MIVNYINSEQRRDYVRVTFIGRDASGRVRRPVIDLDANDLAILVGIAKAFRQRQRQIVLVHTERANRITQSGIPE